LASLFFQSSGALQAQGTPAAPHLVKDINNGAADSAIFEVTAAQNQLYFVLLDDKAPSVAELWKSDGTEAGTVRVKQFTYIATFNPSPESLTPLGNNLFFVVTTLETGRELWVTDGTEAGTVLVKDIHPSDSSYPVGLTVVGDTLFFRATDGVNGYELWKSDGTAAGTSLVKDINTTGSTDNSWLRAIGSTLYFAATDQNGDRELWKSDGTSAGTQRVKDLHPSASGDPNFLTKMGDLLYFFATDADTFGLWQSDGTEAGTTQIKVLSPEITNIQASITTDTLLYFLTYGSTAKLWRSDGTSANTQEIATVGTTNPPYLTIFNQSLFFVASSGNIFSKLWKSDGTTAGTGVVKDLQPGSFVPIEHLTVLNNQLFFTGNGSLWQSDGTENGTIAVSEAQQVSGIRGLTAWDNHLYFAADSAQYGRELWALPVQVPNSPPTAINDTATLDEDGVVTIPILQNDTDSNNNLDPATLSIVQQPVSGTVTISGTTGVLLYTPNANAAGADSFTYRICDTGNVCATATVTITIVAKNDPPVAVNDSTTVVQDSANTVIAVLTNDSDQEKDALSIQSVGTLDRGGTATSQNNAIVYTPAAGFVGNEQFTYTISDSKGGTATATVVVTVTAKEPGSSKKQLFLPTVKR
jgi:ELWxxDGT repeat protein